MKVKSLEIKVPSSKFIVHSLKYLASARLWRDGRVA